jgi:hypothetical protein
MKKLSRQQVSERNDFAQTIDDKYAVLEAAVVEYNATMDAAKAKVEEALRNLNGSIDAAEQWRAAISEQQGSYYDDRSEKWQESDAGERYSMWKDSWNEELQQLDEIEFTPLETPPCSIPDDIDALADNPD